MRSLWKCLTIGLILSALAFVNPILGQQPKNEIQSVTTGGIVTLYAFDPLFSTFCFHDGKEGRIIQDQEVKNRCSEIDYSNYNKGNLTVGIQGGEIGSIVDLGSIEEVQKKYNYQGTYFKFQSFASIKLKDDRLLILREREPRAFTEIGALDKIFSDGANSSTAPAQVGHIYLIKITDRHRPDYKFFVKLMVVSLKPEEFVTFRWALL